MKRLASLARWSSYTSGRWLLGILVSLTVGSMPIGTTYALDSTAEEFPGQMTFQNGKLTAKLLAVPLRKVMKEITRLSGAQVVWLSPAEGEPVSVEFTALPYSEAVSRILKGRNFMLFDISPQNEQRLRQIWICPGGQSIQPMLTTQSAATSQTNSEGRRATESRSLPANRFLVTIFQTAMTDPNPSVRLAAAMRLGESAREDQRARAILSYMARNDKEMEVREAAAELLRTIE